MTGRAFGGIGVRNLGSLMWTAVTVGLCAGLLFAILLGTLENFNYDLTERSMAVGAIAAVITFLIVVMRSTAKRRYRY
jgi:hypothetical protein